jgi:hypothetical protein
MAHAPKPKAKSRAKPKPRFTDKAESKRFIEAARELGIEDASRFDDSFRTVVHPKLPTR